jgi:type IV secretion system protein VirD4
LVIVLENCKPILGEKIRYYREKVFTARLLPPPDVPTIDMDLHFARVQRRWLWAPDELGADERLRLEQLVLDMANVPDFSAGTGEEDIQAPLDKFLEATRVHGAPRADADEALGQKGDDERTNVIEPEPCAEEVMR